jgi:hypothetical protein
VTLRDFASQYPAVLLNLLAACIDCIYIEHDAGELLGCVELR